MKKILISADAYETKAALIEDDRVVETYIEREERRSLLGNIYLAKVDTVLPGMEAAFVDAGLDKNAFLHVAEIRIEGLDQRARRSKRIQDMVKGGQSLLVQVTKDPMKTKGARVTMDVSLAGRFLVYVPDGEGGGVSKRLPDGERRLDVRAEEESLDGDQRGPVTGEQVDQPAVDREEPVGHRSLGAGGEDTMIEGRETALAEVDDAIAERCGPRVDPEDDHPATSAKTSSGMSKLAVTRLTSSRSSRSSIRRRFWRAFWASTSTVCFAWTTISALSTFTPADSTARRTGSRPSRVV